MPRDVSNAEKRRSAGTTTALGPARSAALGLGFGHGVAAAPIQARELPRSMMSKLSYPMLLETSMRCFKRDAYREGGELPAYLPDDVEAVLDAEARLRNAWRVFRSDLLDAGMNRAPCYWDHSQRMAYRPHVVTNSLLPVVELPSNHMFEAFLDGEGALAPLRPAVAHLLLRHVIAMERDTAGEVKISAAGNRYLEEKARVMAGTLRAALEDHTIRALLSHLAASVR